MPTTIDTKDVLKWIERGEKVLRSPLVRPLIMKMLPDLGLTAEQIAALDQRHQDYLSRRARAISKR